MQTKKKTNVKKTVQKVTQEENKKVLDIFRWIALLPVVYFVVVFWTGLILGFTAKIDLNILVMMMILFIGNTLLSFFAARFVAPIYKNGFGWIAAILAAIWSGILVYGLMHIAG